MTDVRLGSKYGSEKTETLFNVDINQCLSKTFNCSKNYSCLAFARGFSIFETELLKFNKF